MFLFKNVPLRPYWLVLQNHQTFLNRMNCFGPNPGFKTDSYENSYGQMSHTNTPTLSLITCPFVSGMPFLLPSPSIEFLSQSHLMKQDRQM